jgi:histidine triad (HIT) family protein
VHLLVVPTHHYESLAEMLADEPAIMGCMASEAMRCVFEHGIALTGFRLVMNSGPDMDQAIAHPHLHVIGGGHLTPHP